MGQVIDLAAFRRFGSWRRNNVAGPAHDPHDNLSLLGPHGAPSTHDDRLKFIADHVARSWGWDNIFGHEVLGPDTKSGGKAPHPGDSQTTLRPFEP